MPERMLVRRLDCVKEEKTQKAKINDIAAFFVGFTIVLNPV